MDGFWLRLLVACGGLAFGAAWLLAATVIDWAAWLMVLPGRRRGELAGQLAFDRDPQSPERRLGEPVEAVASDGVKLAGLWHAAECPRGRTALVIHGFAEDPAALGARMAALNRHGWDVVAVDARAHGRSGGDRGSFGGREAADISTWFDALAATGRARPGPIAAWGRSMGAAIVARAAANDPRISAIVLEAPYDDLEATLSRILRRRRVPFARVFARLVTRRAARLAGVSLTRPRPIDLAPRITCPVLLLHGADDALIPLPHARRLAAAFTPPAEFLEISDAGHNTIVDVGGPPLLDRVADFLDRSVQNRTVSHPTPAESR